MSITTTCPGCGATLTIDENQRSVTCGFCGNHFTVNLEETAPSLNKASPPPEPPASGDYNPPIPGAAGTPGGDLYNPPIPGAAPSPREDVYNPPLEDISSGPGQTYTPPPFSAPEEQPLINRLASNRLWVVIAIAVFIIFCTSCLCMLAVSRAIVNGLIR